MTFGTLDERRPPTEITVKQRMETWESSRYKHYENFSDEGLNLSGDPETASAKVSGEAWLRIC